MEKDAGVLPAQQGHFLIASARQAIARRLGLEIPLPAQSDDPFFSEKHAMFVTLKKKGALRGCIGTLQATGTVPVEIRRLAVCAAFHDHRFPPLVAGELDEIDISVSVLTDSSPLAFSDTVDLLSRLRPGIDGVTIQKGGRTATFLPQVWQELPGKEEFLSHLCLKAGMAMDDWKKPGLSVSTYQVACYGEKG